AYASQLETAHHADHSYVPFLRWRHEHGDEFQQAALAARNIAEWKTDKNVADWSKSTIDSYNAHLSGKILIPQPFATLRNLYEKESGFAISKYLLIEVVVGLIVLMLFSQLAKKIDHGR